MKFHEFVLSRRQKFNLNRHELAEQANISDECLINIERGIRMPNNISELEALADALHVERDWFRVFATMKLTLFTKAQHRDKD